MPDGLPPDFSVVVPTRDRPAQLSACLEALCRQCYSRNAFEVLVVDDGSRVSMDRIAAPFHDRLDLRVLHQAGAGPAKARNHGAGVARGRYLAFTDDDCAPAANWLVELDRVLRADPATVVGGRIENALESNVYSTASEMLLDYLYEYFNCRPQRSWLLASCNFALAAATFHSVGGYDMAFPTSAAEDRDLCDRLRRAGHGMSYAPEALVYHSHRLTALSYWTQHFRYGRGGRRYWRAYRCRSGEGVHVEPPGFYWNMLARPLRKQAGRTSLALAALLALSQVANLSGFLYESMMSALVQLRGPDNGTKETDA